MNLTLNANFNQENDMNKFVYKKKKIEICIQEGLGGGKTRDRKPR